jgi:VIT1/CCC1 family predicted Fe2+/Mn2+ transporter
MEQIDEQHPHKGDWLREIVFGLNDGLVTTLVFIMAVSEIAPGRLLPVVLGEVLAGGISMALGDILLHELRNKSSINASRRNGMRLSMSQRKKRPS